MDNFAPADFSQTKKAQLIAIAEVADEVAHEWSIGPDRGCTAEVQLRLARALDAAAPRGSVITNP